MRRESIIRTGKGLLIGAVLAFSAMSLQACNDQAKEVKTDRALKSNCQMKSMKCKSGKCGDAKKAPAMKCQPGKCATGKCGNAPKEVKPAMKCQTGKCGGGK